MSSKGRLEHAWSATAHLHGCSKHAAVRDCVNEAVGNPRPPRWPTPSLRRTRRVSLLFPLRPLDSGWRHPSTSRHPSFVNIRLLFLLLVLVLVVMVVLLLLPDQRLSRPISRAAEPQLEGRHGIVVCPGARRRRRHHPTR